MTGKQNKVRTSITLDPEILEQIRTLVRTNKIHSTSAYIENALRVALAATSPKQLSFEEARRLMDQAEEARAEVAIKLREMERVDD